MARRMMIFVDGENLVFRYQDMVTEDGRIPLKEKNPIIHIPDTFVWSWRLNMFPAGRDCPIVRANYYASVVGDDDKFDEISEYIRQISIGPYMLGVSKLYPVLFKKKEKKDKGKRLDIQMATDILIDVFQDKVDIVFIFTGDGDFEPIVNEAVRAGKLVTVCAFSKGLNLMLKKKAHEFISLDNYFFEPITILRN